MSRTVERSWRRGLPSTLILLTAVGIGCGDDAAGEDGNGQPASRGGAAGSGDAGGATVGGTSVGGANCEDSPGALDVFLRANKACTRDEDCEAQYVGCGFSDDDRTGVVYLNSGTDLKALQRLRAELLACSEGTGGCAAAACEREPAGSECVFGRCQRLDASGPATLLPAACKQPIEAGPCDAAIERVAFNGRNCVEFQYGGCEGNDNNFANRADCDATCGHFADACELCGAAGCERADCALCPEARQSSGQACAERGLSCIFLPACGATTCTCEETAEGELSWHCQPNPC